MFHDAAIVKLPDPSSDRASAQPEDHHALNAGICYFPACPIQEAPDS